MDGYINWKEGLERNQDGKVRQIPQKAVWSSSLWITRDGICRRRQYQIMSQTWVWADQPQSMMIEEETGRMGYKIDHFLPLETCIALAWKHRVPASPTRTVLDPGFAPDARHITWAVMDTNKEDVFLLGEKFKTLKWRCGVVNCPPSYMISNKGRLRSPLGECTRGFFWRDDFWAAVKGCGLVPLLEASRLKKNNVKIPPYLKLVVDAILTEHTPDHHSMVAGVEVSSSWQYFSVAAAKYIDPADLRRVGPNIVNRDLFKAIHSMQANGDTRLEKRLLELLPSIDKEVKVISPKSDFLKMGEVERMQQLRFAKVCVASTCASLNNCAPR